MYRKQHLFFSLLPFSSYTIASVTLETYVLLKTLHQDAYKVAIRQNILNCATMEDIKALQDSPNETYRAKNFTPLQ